MIGPDTSIVPSLMFHSVGLDRTDWFWKTLSESLASFEAKLQTFARHACRTAFWSEVYRHMAGESPLPANSLMLTFDDGYLDNWVVALPLLRRYGMKATVFVSTDFIEPQGPLRPTIEDSTVGSPLQIAGFMRPAELRAMVESGLIEFQSHAATHTWWFTGNRLIDVYTPAKYRKYPWLAWNARPDRKPYYLNEDQSGYVTSGEPVFAHEKALLARRFFPDAAAVEEFSHAWKGFVSSNPRADEGSAMRSVAQSLRLAEDWPGRFESQEERAERLKEEFTTSRERLEAILQRPVEFICWPGGAYDELAWSVARRCGIKACTLGSQDRSRSVNRPGANPQFIKRLPTQNRMFVMGTYCGMKGSFYQWLRIRAHQRSLPHLVLLQAYKAANLLRARLFGPGDARIHRI